MAEADAARLDDEATCLRILVDALEDSTIVMLDVRGRIAHTLGSARDLLPDQGLAGVGEQFSSLYREDDRRDGKPERDLRIAERDGRFEEECWRIRRDGTPFWARVVLVAVRDAEGKIVGFADVVRDCTRLHDSETKLAAATALLRTTIDSMDDAVLATDLEGRVLMRNGAAFHNPALAPPGNAEHSAELYLADQSTPCLPGATPLARARQGETVQQVELFARTDSDPEGRWYVVNAAPLHDGRGSILGSVAVARDVTGPKTREFELKQLLLVDELTGLCNRRAFLSLAGHQLAVARRTGRPVALFFVDLDGLKEINDRFGHDRGDAALREAGGILRDSFRCSDIVARFGGDEFAVLALDTDGQRVDAARARLDANVDGFNTRAAPYRLSMSVGACVHSPVDTESLESLLARADGAMYEDKRRRHASRPPRCSVDVLATSSPPSIPSPIGVRLIAVPELIPPRDSSSRST